jgi:hypothetical protein
MTELLRISATSNHEHLRNKIFLGNILDDALIERYSPNLRDHV